MKGWECDIYIIEYCRYTLSDRQPGAMLPTLIYQKCFSLFKLGIWAPKKCHCDGHLRTFPFDIVKPILICFLNMPCKVPLKNHNEWVYVEKFDRNLQIALMLFFELSID